jgi:hypothetical protein
MVQYKLKKKFFVTIIIVLAGVIFSGTMQEYLFIFDVDEMINSRKVELNTFGFYLKFLETNIQQYKSTANILRAENYNLFKPDESAVLNVISEIRSNQEFLTPSRRFEEFMDLYPDSIIIKTMYIQFSYNQWTNDQIPETAKKMLVVLDEIDNKIGNNLFTSYYRSWILWRSRLFGNKEKAYTDLKLRNSQFPQNKLIIETLINFGFQLNEFEDVSNYYQNYSSISLKNDQTMAIVMRSFKNSGNILKTREVADWLIKNTTNSYILTTVYETLGDISTTLVQKENFYREALRYDPDNPIILGKVGLVYYEMDPKANLAAVRIYLNKSLSGYPNQPEVEKILNEIRRKIRLNVFLKSILPIVLVVLSGVSLLLYFERKKTNQLKEMERKAGKEE